MMSTLEKDNTAGTDEALLDIYRKLRPGEPPTKESGADPAGEPVLQGEALRPGPRWAATRSTKLGLNAGKPITVRR